MVENDYYAFIFKYIALILHMYIVYIITVSLVVNQKKIIYIFFLSVTCIVQHCIRFNF